MFKLYSYWRSSCSYRVRIALNLKQAAYQIVPLHILRDGGEQHQDAYTRLNPQRLVPMLVDGEFALGQSLAIFQYLEGRVPRPPLVPQAAREAARMWSFCQAIACEIQPLQNTRLVKHLGETLGVDEAGRSAWLRHWIGLGLDALEQELAARPASPFCYGEQPSYADCCLVPQMYAAERFGAVREWPRLQAITARCRELEAFAAAHPERQPDAQKV